MDKNLTTDQLREASKRLQYEIWMMDECCNRLLQNRDQKDEVLHNAVLESFLMHVRVISDFLFDTRTPKTNHTADPNDIIAEDFFTTPTEWIPQCSENLKNIFRKINRAVAHLSQERLRYKPGWYCNEIYNEIVPTIQKFIDTAPRNNLNPDCANIKLQTVSTNTMRFVTSTASVVPTSENHLFHITDAGQSSPGE